MSEASWKTSRSVGYDPLAALERRCETISITLKLFGYLKKTIAI